MFPDENNAKEKYHLLSAPQPRHHRQRAAPVISVGLFCADTKSFLGRERHFTVMCTRGADYEGDGGILDVIEDMNVGGGDPSR